MTIQRIKSGLFIFEGGCTGLDRIKTDNQERIINNRSKQVQPLLSTTKMLAEQKIK